MKERYLQDRGTQSEQVTLVLQHFDWALSMRDDDSDAAGGFTSQKRVNFLIEPLYPQDILGYKC